MRMKIYQKPKIDTFNLSTAGVNSVLCASTVAQTEGFHEYQLITDED